jgi:hypothetical protein
VSLPPLLIALAKNWALARLIAAQTTIVRAATAAAGSADGPALGSWVIVEASFVDWQAPVSRIDAAMPMAAATERSRDCGKT